MSHPDLPTDLGPELFRARLLSGAQTAKAQRLPAWWLLYYVFIPLVSLPLFTLFLGGPLAILVKQSHLLPDDPRVHLTILALCYVFWWWFVYLRPRADHFILHEDGLRIRMGFKHKQMSFDSIQTICTGRDYAGSHLFRSDLNRIFHPELVDRADHLKAASLTITLKNGQPIVFKALLARFDPADIEILFAELLTRHPLLMNPAPG